MYGSYVQYLLNVIPIDQQYVFTWLCVVLYNLEMWALETTCSCNVGDIVKQSIDFEGRFGWQMSMETNLDGGAFERKVVRGDGAIKRTINYIERGGCVDFL